MNSKHFSNKTRLKIWADFIVWWRKQKIIAIELMKNRFWIRCENHSKTISLLRLRVIKLFYPAYNYKPNSSAGYIWSSFLSLSRVKKLSEKLKIQQQPIQSLMLIQFLTFIVNITLLLHKHLITILDLQHPLIEQHPTL